MSRLFVYKYVMREKIINYLTLQAMADPDFEAPMMQRVRCALIIAEKKYRSMSEAELEYIWCEIKKRDKGTESEDLEQGNWD